MQRKILISTMCDGERNYGAALQSYALHKRLEDFGCSTEHLMIDGKTFKKPTAQNAIPNSRLRRYTPRRIIKKVYNIIDGSVHGKKAQKSIAMRHKAFDDFHIEKIPRSDMTYTYDTVNDAVSKYDIFVCGSDQVWNPLWYNEAYRLDFVPAEKPKFSYAASVSANSLTAEQEEVFKNSLSSYIGVSVRESATVSLLSQLSPVKPVLSLDPTLLLARSEWDEISADRVIDSPYMFCYFLDRGKKLRKLARSYAKKHGLKIVAIPHLINQYNKNDKKYSDILVESASPDIFISLIKHANAVFTDSFHASVFSIIYERDFYAFRRAGREGMGMRLKTLTEMFGTEQRFCNTDEKESLCYIENCEAIDYSKQEKYIELRGKSVEYIQEMLEKSERMLSER